MQNICAEYASNMQVLMTVLFIASNMQNMQNNMHDIQNMCIKVIKNSLCFFAGLKRTEQFLQLISKFKFLSLELQKTELQKMRPIIGAQTPNDSYSESFADCLGGSTVTRCDCLLSFCQVCMLLARYR